MVRDIGLFNIALLLSKWIRIIKSRLVNMKTKDIFSKARLYSSVLIFFTIFPSIVKFSIMKLYTDIPQTFKVYYSDVMLYSVSLASTSLIICYLYLENRKPTYHYLLVLPLGLIWFFNSIFYTLYFLNGESNIPLQPKTLIIPYLSFLISAYIFFQYNTLSFKESPDIVELRSEEQSEISSGLTLEKIPE